MKQIFHWLLTVVVLGLASCANYEPTPNHVKQNSPPPKGKTEKNAFGGSPSVFVPGGGSSIEKFETSMR